MKKIIHIDMDCFYAQVEERDNPELRRKPLAIGGDSQRRGVLCTCNYRAREFGLHAGMPTALAERRCADLVLLPPNIAKYKTVSSQIHAIFQHYTELIEPLSLDEAYLDVSHSPHCRGSASLMAKDIRQTIFDKLGLTASAGIATNKLLAKIASDLNKPNGQYLIRPEEVDAFMPSLAVGKLFGVGPKLKARLNNEGIYNCHDLQQLELTKLIKDYGKMGVSLYQYCRGIDNRHVNTSRVAKSISVEKTFSEDIIEPQLIYVAMQALYKRLIRRWQVKHKPALKKVFIKIKFADFTVITREIGVAELSLDHYQSLVAASLVDNKRPVRLLGLGLGLKADAHYEQLILDFFTEA